MDARYSSAATQLRDPMRNREGLTPKVADWIGKKVIARDGHGDFLIGILLGVDLPAVLIDSRADGCFWSLNVVILELAEPDRC